MTNPSISYYQLLKTELAEIRFHRAEKKLERLKKTPHSYDQIEIAEQMLQISRERYLEELTELCLL